jgi:hypothetical protein
LKLLPNYLVIVLTFVTAQAVSQTITYETTVDKMVGKGRKVRKDTLVDIINDSTARTYEFNKKTGKLFLACNKLINGKVTTEYHFDYKDEVLIRVTISEFDFTVRQASFTTYYFRDRKLISVSPAETTPEMKKSEIDILAKADLMYRRWTELEGSRFQ